MNYANIKLNDIANGTGVRTSLFVSGCTHRCKGCFNQIAWDFNYGKPFTDETIKYILETLEPEHISGLTLLGGEPLEFGNQRALLPLLRAVHRKFPEKSVWCYTGYTYETDVRPKTGKAHCEITNELLGYIDVIVDGEFVEDLKDITLQFRGSSNQRIIELKN